MLGADRTIGKEGDMKTKNDWCEWFGHKDKSVGPQDHLYDYQNEGFVCTRCERTHNVNAQSQPIPPPKIRKAIFIALILCVLAAVLHGLSK